MKWEDLPFAYAFPPAPILPRVLTKIKDSGNTVLLIAPAWPRQSWYPDLLQLSVDLPLELPADPDLLSQEAAGMRWTHQNPALYSYHAWVLSSKPSLRTAFLRKLPGDELDVDAPLPTWSTTLDGRNSLLGVTDGRLIHSQPLHN